VLELDLGREGLGLSDEARAELARCDVVIHSAAAVEFDNPADLSAQTNLLGASRLVRAIVESGGRPHLVHVSTAYVGGMLRGLVREELPFDPGLNWRHEAEVLSTLRPAVEEESRRPEVLEKLAQGKNNAAIAGVLFLTERAVEKHINSIFSKLGLAEEKDVHRRVKAALLYLSAR